MNFTIFWKKIVKWVKGNLIEGSYDVKFYIDGSKMPQLILEPSMYCVWSILRRSNNYHSVLLMNVACFRRKYMRSIEHIGYKMIEVFVTILESLSTVRRHFFPSNLNLFPSKGQCKKDLNRLGQLSGIILVWFPACRDQ